MEADLGGVLVGEGHPTYVIAELGINHNGDQLIAEKLIDAAAYAGANAVKLQKRTIDLVYSAEELAKPRESPWGTTTRQQKEGLEFGKRPYIDLARYANAKGLAFTASCWDEQALHDVCEWVDPPWLKIASASIPDDAMDPESRRRAEGLIWAYGGSRKTLVMSTGMSTLDEIDWATRTVSYRQGCNDSDAGLALLACTSTYPCEDEDINLRTITTLRERYRVPVGYSGHDRGIATAVAAVTLGACVIERHLTLDRSMYGSDQAASLEPAGFAKMVRDIRVVEKALGDGVKRRFDSEEPVRAKLRKVGVR